MKQYFGYIRVSTPRQGKGVSLEEQRGAIKGYAGRRDIAITEWFEEKETAAATGRTVFSRMLARLEKGEAAGVIIHKVDRSARNLWDWVSLVKLLDLGIDVQFADEGVDLNSRGGRLSADIMAIVAADYVRNLREEVKKGFYGRLKQGFYPLQAPIGYLDMGGGQVKAVDPERAPLVQLVFTRYATGTIGLAPLRKEMHARGLRSRVGKTVSLKGLSTILHNPFYTGIIRIRRTGETFEGKHTPIVERQVFEQVQAVLQGKTALRTTKHRLPFSRLVRCNGCGRHLTGERQRGHIYYRCHSESCAGTIVRETFLDDLVLERLRLLIVDERDIGDVRDLVAAERRDADVKVSELRQSNELLRAQCEDRIARLTDALIDGLIDKATFDQRNAALIVERQSLRTRAASLSAGDLPYEKAFKALEVASAAFQGYRMGSSDERRRIVNFVMSNISITGKNPAITLFRPFRVIDSWQKMQSCGPNRRIGRTRIKQLLDEIVAALTESPEMPAMDDRSAAKSLKSPMSTPAA